MTIHHLTVSPHVRPDGRNHPSAYDAWLGDRRVCVSETPLCSAARLLLEDGTARPSDTIAMRHAGCEHDALKATVGAAAKLTVFEAGKPRFGSWQPHPMARPGVVGASRMRETLIPAPGQPLGQNAPSDAGKRAGEAVV